MIGLRVLQIRYCRNIPSSVMILTCWSIRSRREWPPRHQDRDTSRRRWWRWGTRWRRGASRGGRRPARCPASRRPCAPSATTCGCGAAPAALKKQSRLGSVGERCEDIGVMWCDMWGSSISNRCQDIRCNVTAVQSVSTLRQGITVRVLDGVIAPQYVSYMYSEETISQFNCWI